MSTLGPGHPAVEGKPPRQLPWRAVAATGISLLIFAGIAVGGWRLMHSPTQRRAVTCPSASPSASTVATLPVRVLNGTSHRGLAGQTADVLRQRGFRIAGVGNAARLRGRSQLRYGTRDALAARVTALQVPDAVLVADRTVTRRVDLVLGGAFRRLRTPTEVLAATKRAKLPRPRPASTAPCR
ncbi:MAG: LytR C-terminal domain-containing protein [Frankiaceae bacterium]